MDNAYNISNISYACSPNQEVSKPILGPETSSDTDYCLHSHIAGWLADVRYGHFEVLKFGGLLFVVSAVLTCICVIIKEDEDCACAVTALFSYCIAGNFRGCKFPLFGFRALSRNVRSF